MNQRSRHLLRALGEHHFPATMKFRQRHDVLPIHVNELPAGAAAKPNPHD